jgi:hypothetical protein
LRSSSRPCRVSKLRIACTAEGIGHYTAIVSVST